MDSFWQTLPDEAAAEKDLPQIVARLVSEVTGRTDRRMDFG